MLKILSALFLLASAPSWGASVKNQSYMFASSYYNSYSDIKLSGQSATTPLNPSYEVELGLRVYNPFSIILIGDQSVTPDRRGFGIGGRIDLPGFILFFPEAKDLNRKSKKYPVNTSAFLKSIIVTVTRADSEMIRTIASNYGFTMDIFLFQPYAYLTAQASIYSLQGNSYFSSGVGLGFQF